MGWFIAGCLIAGVANFWLGYGVAHAEIAKECERLGAFYVGDKVFKCVKVEKWP